MIFKPRAFVRFAIQLPATASLLRSAVPGNVLNLSQAGALFEWNAPPPLTLVVGARFELSFLIEKPEPVRIKTWVTVRWTSPTGVGVQFDGLHQHEAEAVSHYLATLPATSARS
ncbi:MAG: PilZ domain-containing protein [Myxococcales bacterium]|nr:PilZ domain-containing protein [Myxococcales bacterium]